MALYGIYGTHMAQKRPRVESDDDDGNCDKKDKNEKMNVVLALCGAFSPITFLHLRMLGKAIKNESLFLN